jgi:hypothetical protein
MDYNEWGRQYLNEAEKLKEYLTPLRRQARTLSGKKAAVLFRRIAMLNEMYLDCLHTGRFLTERGGSR